MSAAAADHRAGSTRRERRRERKKQRRRRARREAAALARATAEAVAADPEVQRCLRKLEEAEAESSERARRAFEEAERRWLEAAASRAAEKAAAAAEAEARAPETSSRIKFKGDHPDESEEDDEWEYVEDGPAEIIWQGNEITVKKKKVKVPKKSKDKPLIQEEERPTSNPLPPQSVAISSQRREPSLSAQEVLEKVAQETPNFGTEQDKAHCPFYLKTAACRFGVRCSRVHFYPDKSCTLLMKNMYNGPGLALEQDEGLEFTDEEVEQSYEEFYEDVHTEFLKFGELVNFKVCRNGSFHLRGNVYVHYKSLDSALLAYNSMNGRYFAGKQITCEFVAVTKWKAAICGEYMRSRFKTCSHGVACNFIHCFRNPGGDYEWADWDNPPPKHWTRKMVALFGPSDDASFGKASDTPDFEWSCDSDRKRLRSSDNSRHVSSRTEDKDAHRRHSSRDYSHSKHELSSHIRKSGRDRHRREPSAANKQRDQKNEDNTEKHCSAMENERVSYTHMCEERHRNYHDDGGRQDGTEIKSRKHRSEWQESVEPTSDWPSEFTDAGTSKSPSRSKPTDRYDYHKRSRMQTLEDLNVESHYSSAHRSSGKEHSKKRSSRHYIEDDSYHEKDSGRGKSRKHSNHHDDPDDRWLATNSDVDSNAETQHQRSMDRVGKLEKNDNARPDTDDRYERSSSRSTKSRKKDGKSSRKRKYDDENTKDSDSDGDTSDSKDTRDLSSHDHAWRSRSRSSEKDLPLHRSRRK
ncbi:zinc finger CCCH domain-containing protein 16 isoform X3 [Brachypodium distachyon]|uniref:zinc finger CCCH domain-containing protein 16 isoform X3 n=1 Tax=Brachypodium distachyon TaxID=15368 RepID=UPI00052FFA17|nr:zinc finger CCCH domain-containing protein 16 isoform X3 [Brachypodium distachyon]|eukprot:XP_010235550.1 zinc finger CCCH domain-containing protein 16 isoform X3 [Brachypodium distachyon]